MGRLAVVALVLAACGTSAAPAASPSPSAAPLDIPAIAARMTASIPEGDLAVTSVPALKDLVAAGAIVIDVRDPTAYAAGHIPGAVNMPFRTLGGSLAMIPKDQTVVLYCTTGHGAGMSLGALRLLGYENLRIFTPAIGGWRAAGEPVSTEPAVALPAGACTNPDRALVAAVDEWLRGIPDTNYAIGTAALLKETMAQGLVLIDVRAAADYATGHIPGAVNVPIRALARDLTVAKDRPIAVYDATTHLAAMSLATLRFMGYTDVRSFLPNLNGWTKAGEPLAR